MRRWRRVLAIATTQGRDLLRRRMALVMLASLPALFYLSVAGQHIRKGQDPWNLNIAVIGVAWAVGGGAFFLALSSRRVDQRLLLAGYRPTELVLGRLVFLQAFAFMLAAVYSVLFAVRSSAAAGPLILAVAVTALIGVPLGLAVAALLPRELEGTLVLIGVIGVQTSLPSNVALAPALRSTVRSSSSGRPGPRRARSCPTSSTACWRRRSCWPWPWSCGAEAAQSVRRRRPQG